MFCSIWINEVYTKPEINPSYENNRLNLLNTELYKNSSSEDKIFIDEYLELDKSVSAFFYRTAQVHKFVNDDNTCQFIQLIFSDTSLFKEWVINPNYNANYYNFLTAKIWVQLFGVEQTTIYTESTTKPLKFSNYEEAIETLNNYQNK